jgi:E-phenylitaconyl-CoA hydratase
MSQDNVLTSEAPVLVQVDGAVGWVRLNRPDQRNAMNIQMKQDLATAMSELNDNPEVRVIVLTGNGPSFCAGNDLREGATHSQSQATLAKRERITTALDKVVKPVIAAVNGPAYAGGFELALACDLRVASTSATFCLSEVRIGSIPGGGGTQRLPRTVSSAVAAKLIFTGQPIDAEEAFRTGLVSDLFSTEEFIAKVGELAHTIAVNAPLALVAAKRALRGGLENPEGLAQERAMWETVAMSDDYREARAAFREKRPPNFTGT